ncbi:MAG: PD40 domain-containing protein [Anaerolineales bacterium]|nr:PD40 domain-containing protein [Anaerolineales bacterium]
MKSKYKKMLSQAVSVLLLISLFLPASVFPVYAAPGDLTRVSVDSTGVEANGNSRHSQISGDGRFVVFDSFATNLPGETGGLFLKDIQTSAIIRVGVDGEDASISNDGRFIAFESFASNEVSGDTNGVSDVFVYDRQSGVTTRVSVDSSGAQSNAKSVNPVISGDGRFVAFESDATNLVANDTNGVTDIYVRDNQAGITERISLTSDGAGANAISFNASISGDGSVVVFSSNATNLDGNDTNNKTDIFSRTRSNGQTLRVSVNSSGIGADQGATDASISADGRYVSFSSVSENLLSQVGLGFEHAFVRDRQTGITTLVSAYSDGSQMIGDSFGSFVSADGRYVAFEFDERGDGLPWVDVTIHDRQTGVTKAAPNGHSNSAFDPSLSADGRYLAYWTDAPLVAGDTNATNDIFLYEVAFTVDLAPSVVSVQATCGTTCSPAAPVIPFSVTFSEAVTGVTVDDFALSVTGGISGAAVIDVTGSGNAYTVNVNTGTGDGTLRLDVIDNDSIQDATLHVLGAIGAGNGNFNTGQVLNVDKSQPAVINILRADPDLTSANSVHFTVNFSEQVNGVDVSDFTISTIGSISGATVAEVIGSGTAYSVTVNTGTGDGALHVDLIDNDSITDTAANPLGGAGAGNGNFTSGESYTVDKNSPVVVSSLRADANPTAATTVRFTVTFSEAVRGVDVSDFIATASGISGASVTEISRADNIYTITVNTGTGNGTIRLDVIDDDSILDSANHPLGGVGAGNGAFAIGEVYTINKVVITPVSVDFRSTGASDGWILESSENSNIGGEKNSAAPVFKLGDDAKDRQFRSVLHFPTYYLPDNAVVTQVILMIKKQDVVGTDPFTTHQNISVDIRKGYFSNFSFLSFGSLQLTDFQAPADVYSVGTIQNNPVSGWYWTTLDSRAFANINLTDITQLRLAFQLDDNDDLGEDHIRFFSGNYPEQRDRPHLLIEYYVPK